MTSTIFAPQLARQPVLPWRLSPLRQAGLALLACFLFTGCEQPDPIRTYTVSTRLPAEFQPTAQRMMAVMVPVGDQIWFFKLLGPEDAIDSVETEFRDFVTGIEYSDDGPKLDELPDDWERAGSRDFRFASININTEVKQLDLSISQLTAKPDWDAQVAENVNRWRGQVGLEASTEHWAGGETFEVSAIDGPAVWVDLIGEASDTSMAPPFAMAGATPSGATPPSDPHASLPQATQDQIASGAPSANSPAPTSPLASNPPNDTEEGGLTYDRPEGWRDGTMSMMRLAAFEAGPPEALAVITVMSVGGDLRENIARWLGQAGIASSGDRLDQAMADAQSLVVSGRTAQRYILIPDDASAEVAIDGTVIPLEGGFSMFVKMTGPPTTVKEQQEQMSSLLESLSF